MPDLDAYVPQVPASVEEATVKLERFAVLTGDLAMAEQDREAAIAATHAVADAIALPIVEQMAQLRADLEPWALAAVATLSKGKRKTVVLGGCTIGTKAGSSKVTFSKGDDEAAVEALMGVPWARKACVRTSYGVDRPALKAVLEGGGAKVRQLAELGFAVTPGTTAFVLDRVKQPGMVAG